MAIIEERNLTALDGGPINSTDVGGPINSTDVGAPDLGGGPDDDGENDLKDGSGTPPPDPLPESDPAYEGDDLSGDDRGGGVVPQPIGGGVVSTSKDYSTLAGARQEQDVDFAKYQTTGEDADVAAGQSFSTPETTVQGQLEKIIAKGSPLQALAETRSREQASALGMMSSSAGIGAGQRALYDSAMPIAQQDADTMAKFKQSEQAAVNQKRQIDQEAIVAGDLTLQKARLQEQQSKIDDSFAIAMKGLDANMAKNMQDWKANTDKEITQMNIDAQDALDKSGTDAGMRQQVINQAHDQLNQYQISVQNLLADTDFIDMMTPPLGDDPTEQEAEDAAEAGRANMEVVFTNMMLPVRHALYLSANVAGIYNTGFQQMLDSLINAGTWKGELTAEDSWG